MKKYANFISEHKKMMALLIITINILAIIGIFRINLSISFDVFKPRESEYLEVMDEVESVFDSTETLSLVIELDQDINENVMKILTEVNDELSQINGVKSVNGPKLDSRFTVEQQLAAYESLGKFNPIINKDNKNYAFFQVLINSDFVEADIQKLETIATDQGLTYYLAGDLYMQQKIFDYIFSILTRIPPVALLLILLVFNTQIRNIKATIISVIPAAFGALWTMGLIGWTGTEVSLVTVLAPIFAIVIGSADGLHFVSHVQEARHEGLSKIDSIAQTLKMVGIPMIITTVTSIGGFLALLAIDTEAIASFALFASIGVGLAGIATWLVHPLILSTNIDVTSKRKNKEVSSKFLRIWGWPSVIIALVLIDVAFFAYPSINSEFNQLMIYKEHTDVQKSFSKILDVNDGAVPVTLFVEGDDNLLLFKNARKIMSVSEELEQLESVSKVVSPIDMVKIQLNQLGMPSYPVGDQQMMMLSNNLPPQVNSILSTSRNEMIVMIYPRDFSNETLDEISKVVSSSDLKMRLTGSSYLMRDLNSELATGQIKSSLVALATIFVLMLISLRKITIAFIATIPIVVTVIFMYGFLGLSGISLNIITATIFSITIGVGIDYAVHYTSVFKEYRSQGLSSDQAAKKALHYTERPIVANAFGVAIGLSALFISPLLIHNYVAILMWVSMLVSVFLSLSFLPTILRLTK